MSKKYSIVSRVGLLVLLVGFLCGCKTVDETGVLETAQLDQPAIATYTRNVSSTPLPTNWLPTLSPTQTPSISEISGVVVYPGCLPPTCSSREIFLANLDTHEITQLTFDSNGSGNPVWSPDGKQIAFVSNRNGDYDVYIMNADGSNQHQLTDYDGYDAQIDISPDGQKIVFVSDRTGKPEIYTIEIYTKAITQLTSDSVRWVGEPSWSSDGERIAYLVSEEQTQSSDVYIMDADGSNVIQITDMRVDHARPTWCPDDTCLIYEAHVGADNNPKLLLMDLKTGQEQQLLKDTPFDLIEWYPSKSPERGYIVFSTYDQYNMLYALDMKNNHLYSLGLQAGDAALYP